MTHESRPGYVLTLMPAPGTDAIRNLRGALKVLGRRFGLRCTGIQVYESGHAAQSISPSATACHGRRNRADPFVGGVTKSYCRPARFASSLERFETASGNISSGFCLQ
jgi:hypothetical protein